jgi:hypothetical protein
MTLMAGFDLVTEISNATILKMIKANVTLGGVPLNPPFDLTLPIAGGSAHIVVNDLQIDLSDDDTLTLNLGFVDTSAVLGPPISRVVCKLSGTVKVRAPIQLVAGPGPTRLVAVNMPAATVSITYTSQANQAITGDLAGSGITAAQFKLGAATAITNFIHGVPMITMPMAFTVIPGTNGSLTPLQFTSLEVHCIGHSDRSKQALGIFGNLLASTQNNGDHTQKTGSVIPAGSDIAVSVGPGAFHTLVFCPAVADALEVNLGDLPTSCGSASGVEVEGVTITSITDSFANGHINVNGSIEKSGFCYDASGTFHGEITMDVSGSNIEPTLAMDEPNVEVDIPWYCYLVAGVVLGPIGAVTAAVIDSVMDDVAKDLASSALKDALGSGLSGINVNGFTQGVFTSVVITPAGLTMRGLMPIFPPISQFWKHQWLDGSVTTTSKTKLSAGIYTTKFWCMEAPKDYPYTEYAQTQVATYDLETYLTATPVSAVYALRSTKPGSPSTPLTGSSGSVTIDNVDTTYIMPLGTGGTKVTQSVHLDYEIAGTQIKLHNQADEGNFSVYLTGQFTDCGGEALSSQNRTITFMGNNVELGNGYYTDYQECMNQLKKQIEQITKKYKPVWDHVPIWVKVNYPPPDELIQQIRILTEIGLEETETMLLESRIAHGAAFNRALHADSQTQLGRVARADGSARAAQLAAQEVELQAQIAALTTQLDALQAARHLATSGLNMKLKPVIAEKKQKG